MSSENLKRVALQSLQYYPPDLPISSEVQETILGLWAAKKDFIVLSGPPGVGKSRSSQDLVIYLLNQYKAPHNEEDCRVSNLFPEFQSRLYSRQEIQEILSKRDVKFVWDFCVLHPQYTYEDLIRGYRMIPGANESMSLRVREGILGFVARVVAVLEETAEDRGGLPKGLLVLDEINRAPIGQLFGEALFAIDRRGVRVATPYSLAGEGATLQIPQSLLLLGTMNSIDRATAGFDFALRRRLTIIPVESDHLAVEKRFRSFSDGLKNRALTLYDSVRRLVENASQTGLIPLRELVVGHAYFLPPSSILDETSALNWLDQSYKYQILPTLVDYREQGLLEYKDDFAKKLPNSDIILGRTKPYETEEDDYVPASRASGSSKS